MLAAAICKRRTLQFLGSNGGIAFTISRSQLGFLHNVRLLSSSSPLNTQKHDDDHVQKHGLSVANYLMKSCGMSPHSAELVSKKVHFDTTENPDKVIGLLRDYGFTDAHISKIIRNKPQVLSARPDTTIVPKLDFLRSIGASSTDLAKIVSGKVQFLYRSLEHYLIPSYNILKSILFSDEKVVTAFRRVGRMHMNLLPTILPDNLSLLRETGMPEHVICYLLTNHPSLACLYSDKLRQDVKKLIEIGFDPSKKSFVNAFAAISLIKQETLEHKMKVYGRWSLSKDEIWSAFKKQPTCMLYSEKKIVDTMDFLVNKMGWQPAEVLKDPRVIGCSFDKRIVPRCSVVRVLVLKGLVTRKISLSYVLKTTNEDFLNSFVVKYEDVVPQLSSIFYGKTSILELGFGFEENAKVDKL